MNIMESIKNTIDKTENDIMNNIKKYQTMYNINKYCDDAKQCDYIAKINLNNLSEKEIDVFLVKSMSLSDKIKYLLMKQITVSDIDINLNNLKDFSKVCTHYFSLYKANVLTNTIEDDVWNIHDKSSLKYNINDNEIIFENTISSVYCHDKITLEYLESIILLFNKISRFIKVSYKFIDLDQYNISIIIIRAKLNTTDRAN